MRMVFVFDEPLWFDLETCGRRWCEVRRPSHSGDDTSDLASSNGCGSHASQSKFTLGTTGRGDLTVPRRLASCRIDTMSRLPHLRLIIEAEPQSGAWNMAVDEALLERAVADDLATLRWYRWREPTISIGYFQKSADWLNDPLLSRFPAVRRLSGGGAIIHDQELTYSLVLPASQKLIVKPQELYDIVHRCVMNELIGLGIPISVRGTTLKKADEPFLCFQRQDGHDLVLGGFKVLGSAQRRRHGALMQHGSLIHHSSKLAPHIPGLAEICGVPLPANLEQILAVRLAESLSETWRFETLHQKELEMVQRICRESGARLMER
jgi:lipoate-protein ligase A